ncbi:VOC family protein [Leifsonia sp. NPDC080035]|uniref:VOC family protein n=1 Tax=Leifsonia sp. NPDC080035 TaxID=3143936 RepID=A0AAU7G6E5_9MICO
MSAHEVQNPVAPVRPGAMMLELVMLPVTDIEEAKAFYRDRVGFTVDVDVTPVEGVRIVQLTPPGSYCSVTMASGLADGGAAPGSVRGLHLVVADIDAARAALVARGVEVDPVVDRGGGVLYAGFSDPDGNTWTLQHMPWRG